jgi:predicted PurR-regulated permease PerM
LPQRATKRAGWRRSGPSCGLDERRPEPRAAVVAPCASRRAPGARRAPRGRDRRHLGARPVPRLPAAQADRLDRHRGVPGRRRVCAGQPPEPLHAARLRDRADLPRRAARAGAVGLLIVPPIVREGNQLAEDLPGYIADVRDFVQKNSTLQKLEKDYGITSKLEDQASKLPGKLGGAAGALGKIGVRLVNSLFAAVNILILSIFMVSAGPRWVRAIVAMQQPGHRARMERVFSQTSRAVGAYIGGALLQATVAGVSTFIVLEILGVPFAAPLSVLVFFFDLIPLVGATIGAVLVGLVTAFNDFPTTTIIWTIWAIVYQQLENNLIQPRIQSKAVNVEGFFVLVAVLFGATLFGVLGALFAIPVAATVQIVIAEYTQYRREVTAEATLEAASQTPVQVRTR